MAQTAASVQRLYVLPDARVVHADEPRRLRVDDSLAPLLANQVELRSVRDVRLRALAHIAGAVRLAVPAVHVILSAWRQRRRIRQLVHVTLCIG